MEQQLPATLAQAAQCYSCEELEDGKCLIGLCTKSAQFLELVDKQIEESIDLEDVGNDVYIFTSYNPLQKYFLIRCKNTLIVIKRSKPLCIFKKFENVVQVVIQDRLRIGRPQAVIWTLTDKDPIVTDFVGQLQPIGPQHVPQLTASLNTKLQEMSLRLTKARKLLQEKQTARINALFQLTPHLQVPESQTKAEPKVLVWGPPFPTKGEMLLPPLRMSRPWARCHNSKWVVGIPVFNSSNQVVKDVSLRLQVDCQQDLRHETHVIVFPERQSCGAEWTALRHQGPLFLCQDHVPGLSAGVIVGVLEELLFKKSQVISITGAVFYKQSETHFQDILCAAVEFKVEDLVQGKLKPFVSPDNCDESELITVAVCSGHWPLAVSVGHGLPTLSSPLHLAAPGLLEVPPLRCWVGRAHGTLEGVLVTHSQHRLDLYARDVRQAVQLVHSLRTLWKLKPFKNDEVTLQICVKSFAAELKLLRRTMLPGAHCSPEKWMEFRNHLSDLELKTDFSFMSYLPD